MPVVFTSAIGLGGDTGVEGFGELGYGISQTPQVWIDCQNIERSGGLATNWDVREGVFPDGVVDDMFAAYAALLRRLAGTDEAWEELAPVALPEASAHRRAEVNATAAPLPDGLLHEGVLAQALRTPDRVAVVAPDATLTYRQLAGRAAAVAAALADAGCAPGDLVAVVADKGWRQVVAVFGVLLAGAAYVPIDTNQPPARRDLILADAGIRHVLTEGARVDGDWPAQVLSIAVDDCDGPAPTALPARLVGPDDLAYVIYTSGLDRHAEGRGDHPPGGPEHGGGHQRAVRRDARRPGARPGQPRLRPVRLRPVRAARRRRRAGAARPRPARRPHALGGAGRRDTR